MSPVGDGQDDEADERIPRLGTPRTNGDSRRGAHPSARGTQQDPLALELLGRTSALGDGIFGAEERGDDEGLPPGVSPSTKTAQRSSEAEIDPNNPLLAKMVSSVA